MRDPVTGTVHSDWDNGIPIGKIAPNGEYHLFNHFILYVKTQPVPGSNNKFFRIVGFDVEARSYADMNEVQTEYKEHKPLSLDDVRKGYEFKFTYTFASLPGGKNELWANRMDHYMKLGNENIHMASILLSLGIIITLSCIISSLMKRGLNKDFVNIIKNKLQRN